MNDAIAERISLPVDELRIDAERHFISRRQFDGILADQLVQQFETVAIPLDIDDVPEVVARAAGVMAVPEARRISPSPSGGRREEDACAP